MTDAGTILVVDNDADNLIVLEMILIDAGYRVNPVSSGELALDAIDVEHPALILLDIRMPGMDGFTLCQLLKAREETRDIPIIFISGTTKDEKRDTGFRLGGVDFISKPFRKEELLARVKTHLALRQALLKLEQQSVELLLANERLRADNEERKEREKMLLKSERQYRLLFEEMLSGFAVHEIICDQGGKPVDYRFLSLNSAFEKMTGLVASDIIGKTVLEVLPGTESTWIEQYGQVALSGKPIFFEDYSRTMGKHFEIRAFCPEAGKFATIFNDISERKKMEAERIILEERIRQQQRLETVGQLAAGIAHDFNNILTGISGFTQFAYDALPAGGIREDLAEVQTLAKRAVDLTQQLLIRSYKLNVKNGSVSTPNIILYQFLLNSATFP